MTFIDLPQLYRDVLLLASKLPKIDMVVGVPRSGMLPATLLANHLHCHLGAIGNPKLFLRGGMRDKPEHVLDTPQGTKEVFLRQTILVLDDSYASGHALQRARKAMETFEGKVFYASVYGVDGADLDFMARPIEGDRLFAWNYLNCGYLDRSSLDIDGLLCVDPTPEENDDGPRYEEFIRNAKPIHLPKYPIHSLVTGRLEKHRKGTEDWLRKWGVEYKHLVMIDAPTREAVQDIALFKADAYKHSDNKLFIESDDTQAQRIASISGKPVICSTTQRLYDRP